MTKNFKKRVMATEGKPSQGKQGKNDSENDADKTKMKKGLAEAIIQEKPNVRWDDIAGLEEAKKILKQALILPKTFDFIFSDNAPKWKGMLMYGPPGTGKTFLAKACATECDSTFLSISSADLMSKYQGESEKLVKELFELAREKQPAIIFIDEIDSICGTRGEGENESSWRVKNEILTQMDGIGAKNSQIYFMGATNIPWSLDPAIRRRFDHKVFIPLPELPDWVTLMKLKLKGLDENISEQDYAFIGA